MIREHVHDIVTVTEAGIIDALRLVWERMKIIVEPSAAVPFGALMSNRLDIAGKRVGIILSGGNLGRERLAALLQRHAPHPRR